MFLTEIYESKKPKHVAFCFGRVNPPTIGHGKLFATTHKAAMGGDYYIFLSHTQDKKDNPLDYATKVSFVKKMFPKYAEHVSTGGLRTIIEIAGFLYDHGYTHVTFVAGSDRIEAFQKLLTSYNGVQDKKTYYKFANIDFVSSGDREDGAEGVEGVSASQARAAAIADNMEAFKTATGAGRLAQSLFKAVRNGMGLTESVSETQEQYSVKANGQEMPCSDYDHAVNKARKLLSYGKTKTVYILKNGRPVHSWQLGEKLKDLTEGGGVGVVKGGNDPRYKNALTVDVKPNTLGKEMKAFGLVGRKNPGVPTRQTPVGKNIGKGAKLGR